MRLAANVIGRISASGIIVSSTGFYGNGDNLTGVLKTGDNFGSHIASKTIDMSSFAIGNSTSITASYFYGNVYF